MIVATIIKHSKTPPSTQANMKNASATKTSFRKSTRNFLSTITQAKSNKTYLRSQSGHFKITIEILTDKVPTKTLKNLQ